MFKSIDDDTVKIEGFYYRNKYGHNEYVVLNVLDDLVDITPNSGQSGTPIYVEDIPKLIKALDAAHKHMNGI